MRVICNWYRRQLVRRLLLKEPIPASSRLGRHLEGCAACTQARADFVRLQDALPGSLPAPELSSDFSARLRTRLQRQLNERASNAQPTAASHAVLPMHVVRG